MQAILLQPARKIQTELSGESAWNVPRSVPAWMLSLVVHLTLIIALGLVIRDRPERGMAGGGVPWEMSLSFGEGDAHPYEDAGAWDASSEPSAAAIVAAVPAATDLGAVVGDQSPVDIATALPSSVPAAAESLGTPGLTTAAGDLTKGLSGGGRGAGSGGARGIGAGRTSVYGLQGEGFKFVYVFDRSGSMGGSGHSALNAAKAELTASLENLQETHQFQIIFYNERPTIMSLRGSDGRLVFGNEQNKRLAHQFIREISADGATRHMEALELAISLGPDVIFFLTDADQPELTRDQLSRIEKRNAGRAVIHAIEFGLGPPLDRDNFLVNLARQNRGQHTYVDVLRLGAH